MDKYVGQAGSEIWQGGVKSHRTTGKIIKILDSFHRPNVFPGHTVNTEADTLIKLYFCFWNGNVHILTLVLFNYKAVIRVALLDYKYNTPSLSFNLFRVCLHIQTRSLIWFLLKFQDIIHHILQIRQTQSQIRPICPKHSLSPSLSPDMVVVVLPLLCSALKDVVSHQVFLDGSGVRKEEETLYRQICQYVSQHQIHFFPHLYLTKSSSDMLIHIGSD